MSGFPERLGMVLRQLRHPLWGPAAPKGYGDTLVEWADPDSLMNRAELGRTVARRLGRSLLSPEDFLDVLELPEGDPLPGFLADSGIDRDERIALAIGGPAFQWR